MSDEVGREVAHAQPPRRIAAFRVFVEAHGHRLLQRGAEFEVPRKQRVRVDAIGEVQHHQLERAVQPVCRLTRHDLAQAGQRLVGEAFVAIDAHPQLERLRELGLGAQGLVDQGARPRRVTAQHQQARVVVVAERMARIERQHLLEGGDGAVLVALGLPHDAQVEVNPRVARRAGRRPAVRGLGLRQLAGILERVAFVDQGVGSGDVVRGRRCGGGDRRGRGRRRARRRRQESVQQVLEHGASSSGHAHCQPHAKGPRRAPCVRSRRFSRRGRSSACWCRRGTPSARRT